MKFQERLYTYLRDNDVPFTIQHMMSPARPRAFDDMTAGDSLALVRTEFVFVGNQLTMLALDEAHCVDLELLRRALRRPDVTIVDSIQLDSAFPDVDIDTIPPIGVFWQLPVIMDSRLSRNRLITFYAGTRQDLVTLHRLDFERLSRPAVIDFTVDREPALTLHAQQPAVGQ